MTLVFYVPWDRVVVQYVNCDRTWDAKHASDKFMTIRAESTNSYKKPFRVRSYRWRNPVTQDSSRLVRLCGEDT